MEKLYDRIDFVNDNVPALNASNMNAMSKAIDDIDNRLCEIIPADDYVELTQDAIEASNKAIEASEKAEAIVGIGIATTTQAGIVKPDGETITVDTDGTIHSAGSSTTGNYNDLLNKPKLNGIEIVGNKTSADYGLGKQFTATLSAGSTHIEFDDAIFNDNSIIDVYTSVYGINPTDVTVTTGTILLDFSEQSIDVDIMVIAR